MVGVIVFFSASSNCFAGFIDVKVMASNARISIKRTKHPLIPFFLV
jgi:hypothetical protein